MGRPGIDSENGTELLSFEGSKECSSDEGLNLVVQGKPLRYHGARDIRALLESQGQQSVYANVRLNGEVLSRRDFENIPLNDGDEIDFLYFMGGGSAI